MQFFSEFYAMEKSFKPSTSFRRFVCIITVLSCIHPLLHPVSAQGSFTRADDYLFLHPEANVIQNYGDHVMDDVRRAWNQSDSSAFVIAHFGDEHIQGDMLSGQLQKILQAEQGNGGWGMLQPTSVARTFSSVYYTSSHKGTWRYDIASRMTPSIPRGLSGMVAKTADEHAELSFAFQEKMLQNPMRLQIFCSPNKSFDLLWVSDTDTVLIQPSSMDAEASYIEASIPPFDREFSLMCKKTSEDQTGFVFHGANLLYAEDAGLVYHSLGVEGSGYAGILNAEEFSPQLSSLDPDMVILDFAIAELSGRDVLGPSTKTNISRTIAKVKRACPNAAILLMSAQDMYRGKQENMAVTEEYSALLQEIAKEKGCLFYDWFWASGGRTSILEWRKRSLAGVHLVSLTPRGYRLKAEMLGEALLVAFTDTSNQPFEVDVEAFQEAQIDRLRDFQTLEVATSTTTQEVATTNSNIRADSPPVVEPGSARSASRSSKITHVVSAGEFLGAIAKRYNVGLSQILEWNNLTESSILAIGQRLTLYTDGRSTSSATSLTHTVKSGEVLSVIAERYNVGLSQILEWNNLTESSILAIGQQLTIYAADGSAPSPSSKVIHTVKSGEVLSVIAERYNVGLSQVIDWNDITNAANLRIGQELVIYPGQGVFTSNRAPSSNSSSSSTVIHTVKSGEVLSVIAEKYNVGLSQVIEWNNIDDAGSLRVGQELTIYPDRSNLE